MDTTRRSVWLLVALALVSISATVSGVSAAADCRPIRAPLPAVITEGGVVRNNQVLATGGTGIRGFGEAPAVGIQVSAPAPRVLNN